MAILENLALVFVAGFVTALATGLGALPFFFFDDIGDGGTSSSGYCSWRRSH